VTAKQRLLSLLRWMAENTKNRTGEQIWGDWERFKRDLKAVEVEEGIDVANQIMSELQESFLKVLAEKYGDGDLVVGLEKLRKSSEEAALLGGEDAEENKELEQKFRKLIEQVIEKRKRAN